MMRVQSVSEMEGGAVSDWKPCNRPCRYCKTVGRHSYRVWESSDGAYTDNEYECRGCRQAWWEDGAGFDLAGRRSALPGRVAAGRRRAAITARPWIAVVTALGLIGSGALKELARRFAS
jgi:hypothetical protein